MTGMHRDGKTLTSRVTRTKGQRGNPLTVDELGPTVRDCQAPLLPAERIRSVPSARSLETPPHVGALARLMSAGAR